MSGAGGCGGVDDVLSLKSFTKVVRSTYVILPLFPLPMNRDDENEFIDIDDDDNIPTELPTIPTDQTHT